MIKRAIVYFVFAFLIASGFATLAEAQQSGEEYHYIMGFRSAHFGMTKSEVRSAIVKDFGVSDHEIDEMLNLDQGTTILAVTVPSLSPGPGPALIFYILGASSGELNYINVIWSTTDTPTQIERERIAVAGMQLAHYFENLSWKPEGSVSGVSLNLGEVLTFAGVDPKDSGVQVIISGVPMTDAEGNAIELSGPARLQISYSAHFGEPDVATVEPGAF